MPETETTYSLLDVLISGGWTMIPLGICSVVMLAIVIERFSVGPRRSRVIPERLLLEIRELLRAGRIEEVAGITRASNAPLARVVNAMIRSYGKPREQMVEAATTAGRREALEMQRYVGTLGTIASISPLLGLLGTVSGMIRTFGVIQQMGVGHAQALAGGISEALVATASGLSVAIPALLFHRFFSGRIKTLVSELEEIALDLLNILDSDTSGSDVSARTESGNVRKIERSTEKR